MIEKRQPIFLDVRSATIRLSHGLFAIIDVKHYEKQSRYRWRATRSSHCFYATRKVIRSGHEKIIYLHRVVANTPPGMDCHHKNRYTLDCREENLENKTPPAHKAEHGRPG